METPVEPLDGFTDTVTGGDEAETTVLKETEVPATNDDQDELPNAVRVSSVRAIDPRLDTQRHLSLPLEDSSVCEIPGLDVNQPVDEASEQEYYDEPTPREKFVVVAKTTSASPRDAPDVPRRPEPVVATPAPKETVDLQLGKVHEFLYHKILDNQCSSHAKEIHEFINAHLNSVQQAQLLPSLFTRLSQKFQDEAATSGQQEVSVDIQSSLCLLEQMFLSLGRLSPLQDMYTAEEAEMLDELAHDTSGNNTLQL